MPRDTHRALRLLERCRRCVAEALAAAFVAAPIAMQMVNGVVAFAGYSYFMVAAAV